MAKLIEFKHEKNKPLEEKKKLYRKNMIILWTFTAIMFAVGLFLTTFMGIKVDKQEKFWDTIDAILEFAVCIIAAICLVGGGCVVMAFAIIYTRLNNYYNKPQQANKPIK